MHPKADSRVQTPSSQAIDETEGAKVPEPDLPDRAERNAHRSMSDVQITQVLGHRKNADEDNDLANDAEAAVNLAERDQSPKDG